MYVVVGPKATFWYVLVEMAVGIGDTPSGTSMVKAVFQTQEAVSVQRAELADMVMSTSGRVSEVSIGGSGA